jgi:hypothetical protein
VFKTNKLNKGLDPALHQCNQVKNFKEKFTFSAAKILDGCFW